MIYLPHDSKQKKVEAQKSTYELACEHFGSHKIHYIPQTNSTIEDIQQVRAILPRCRFDTDDCFNGIRCLENYKKEYDDKKKVFKNYPRHDWASHGADSFRYFAVSNKDVDFQDDEPIIVDFSELV